MPLAALIAIAALGLTACGNDEPAKPKQSAADAGTFVGTVDGTTVNIGLVVKDNRLAGFACSKKEIAAGYPKKASFALAPVDLTGNKATLQTDDGTEVGSVAISGDNATGKLDVLGYTQPFTAERATGDAGVFRLPAEKEGEPWTGWVVLNDGSFTGNAKGKPSSGQPWINPDQEP
jgi:hypothetical protein